MIDDRILDVSAVRTELLFDIVVNLDPDQKFGDCGKGVRKFFPASGGSFTGPLANGIVLPGGGDWAVFDADGNMHLDVRLGLKTHDGQNIFMTYQGRFACPPALQATMADRDKRHTVNPDDFYFRTNPLFETSVGRYQWLNTVVAVGIGYFVRGGVAYRISKVV